MGHSHTHAPLSAGNKGDERYLATRRVTIIGAVVNLLLSIGKVVIGVIGGSPALVADGIHSLSDLLTDIMVVWAAKHGSKDADEDHPYGHGRIETVSTVILGLVLLLVAVGIIYDAASRLFHPERLTHPGMLALVMAAISVLSKEVLYLYTLRVAKRLRSNLLKANAWHHRSDAISSIVVIVGIAGTMAGLPYLDAIAAAAVGLMIAKIAWDLAWHAVHELVDTALEAERVEAIRRVIQSVDGVNELHTLRTRRMGADALVDVHIQVDPLLSVSEGHHISERVRQKVIREIDEVQDVLVHIDPEDDEQIALSAHLPSRQVLLARLREFWQDSPAAARIRRVTLHYLDGKLRVEVYLPLELARDEAERQQLTATLQRPVRDMPEIESLTVHYN
ncbi:MAG: cation diffusion facilitator family transporter [Thiohalomonadaceae bacterium]